MRLLDEFNCYRLGSTIKKPGKEIKERNVEDSETAGFLEISSVYKNVSWGE